MEINLKQIEDSAKGLGSEILDCILCLMSFVAPYLS